MNKEPNTDIQNWIEELKKDRVFRFMNTGASSYKQLGFIILSLLNTCQTHLFSLENKAPTKEQEQELRMDIYNLLEMAKNLLPHIEFEFLDKVLNSEDL
ncbi:hypothetical protein ETU10_08825 [Apibacter muscae]|uniref:hypothetical protein n=1 Tax=Apibacter muscae TaxID=2509004 RepID=UPI0011ACD55F|nr:hypothetical protein [Apibacter muscae]TWP22690.1 hypothetical protein ETU10_08825 [Apibacter muscae]